MKKILYSLIIQIALISTVYGQYVEIQDENFKQCLLDNYSEVMNQDREMLDLSEAEDYEGAITCTNKNIESVNELIYFEKAAEFNFSDNNIESLPIFPSNMDYKRLIFSNNQLTSFPNTSGRVSQIENIILDNNNISDMSKLGEYTYAKSVNIFGNPVSELPDLTELDKINGFILGGNQLSPNQLSWIVTHPKMSNIFLYNQSTYETENVSFSPNEETIISYNETDYSEYKYRWYVNDMIVDGEFSKSLTLTKNILGKTIRLDQYGNIGIERIDSVLFRSTTFNISFLPCNSIDHVHDETTENCKMNTYYIDEILLSNEGSYSSYFLVDIHNSDTVDIEIQEEKILPHGTYYLIGSDNSSCTSTYNELIVMTPPPTGCDLYFSPNGDGICDDFLIEIEGSCTIYDSQRNQVNTMECPGKWDGKDENGLGVRKGVYVIENGNGDSVKLSVVY